MAIQRERAIRQNRRRHQFIIVAYQRQASQWWPEVITRRIVLDILSHTEKRIGTTLWPLILAASPSRRNLHDKIGRFGFVPQHIRRATVFRGSKDDEDIRSNDGFRVTFFVVDEEIARHIHIGVLLEVRTESLHGIRQGLTLEVTFSHRLTILTGIVDVRSGGTAGDGHGETPHRNEGYKTITPTMQRSIACPR